MKPSHAVLAVIAVVATIAAAVFAGLYFTTDSDSEPVSRSSAATECSGTSRLSRGTAIDTK